MTPSCRDILEEPRIAPPKATLQSLGADASQVRQRRLPVALLPAGDERLAHASDPRELALGDAKNGDSNCAQLVHANCHMPTVLTNQYRRHSIWHGAVDMPLVIKRSMDVSAVLQAVMKATGWSQEELAHNLNVGQSAVSHWLRGSRVPGGLNIERIRQLAIDVRVIPAGPPSPSARPPNQVAIMGRVGAGALIDVEYDQSAEGHDSVELPFSYPDPIVAFEIEGDSQLPVYEPGAVIVCLRDQVRATDHYLGMPVVVRLASGERYLKRLARGSSKGRYNLESWNARPIEDVRVEWVGEIIATVNRTAIRRIEPLHQNDEKVRLR